MEQSFRFNVVFLGRFFKILRVIFPRLFSSATLLFIFLLAMCLLEQVVVYSVGILPSKFYKILGDKDIDNFKPLLIYAFTLIIAVAGIASTVTYISSVLYIVWRRNLTLLLHQEYFKNNNYYAVNVLRKEIDNPDQRITQDVDRMCKQFSTVLAPIIISPFTIIYYTYQAVLGTGYIGPVSIFSFFILGTFCNKLLMSPVVEKVFQQEKEEGNFRYKHMQIRTHAESAAFYQCGELEKYKTNVKLLSLLNVQNELIGKQYALNCVVKLFDYLGSILSYVVIAIPIFAGHYDDLRPTDLSELISRNGFVCIYLISCFTKLLDQAVTFTDVAGTAHRIGDLLENLGKHSQHFVAASISKQSCNMPEFNSEDRKLWFNLENITIMTPSSNETIIKDVSVQICAGERLVVRGASSCGKTSLVRVLSGLWSVSAGEVRLGYEPSVDTPHLVMFLPQLPYLTNGTLREQIIFPKNLNMLSVIRKDEDDQRLLDIIKLTKLDNILKRVDGLDKVMNWNWHEVLSPGEMQRFSFARLFYHKPKLAVLDEASSALSSDMESALYGECVRLGMSVLSVGHRDSLDRFHTDTLQLTAAPTTAPPATAPPATTAAARVHAPSLAGAPHTTVQ